MTNSISYIFLDYKTVKLSLLFTEGIIPDNQNIVDDISEQNESKIHSKFHFYDFLYNNFYSDNCCKTSPTQEVLSACNDIITKYYSIDAVIYNQLRLENLFRDYKWNNPKLNNITNNDLISQIKTISGNLIGT